MDYTIQQRGEFIISACQKETSQDPINIFESIVKNDFVRIHGPEHHILDGACVLTAFYNAGGHINLQESLQKMFNEGLKMPGGTCGLWGVCGSCSSIGTALAIIDNTGPLSTNAGYSEHLLYTSKVLNTLADIGGPRCCKRNAYLSLLLAIKHIDEYYNIQLENSSVSCTHSKNNKQCIKVRCPFYNK